MPEPFTCIDSSCLTMILKTGLLLPHFTDAETETQKTMGRTIGAPPAHSIPKDRELASPDKLQP